MPIFFLSGMLSISNAQAQIFFRSDNTSVDPRQVIAENYSVIRLPDAGNEETKLNIFNRDNPFTWLQFIADERQKTYHIIYQTSFTGRLLYLGISNNLLALFSKKEKPMFVFNDCLEKIRDELMSERIREKAIDCILERLAYCSR
jgi:hypothetical protein